MLSLPLANDVTRKQLHILVGRRFSGTHASRLRESAFPSFSSPTGGIQLVTRGGYINTPLSHISANSSFPSPHPFSFAKSCGDCEYFPHFDPRTALRSRSVEITVDKNGQEGMDATLLHARYLAVQLQVLFLWGLGAATQSALGPHSGHLDSMHAHLHLSSLPLPPLHRHRTTVLTMLFFTVTNRIVALSLELTALTAANL